MSRPLLPADHVAPAALARMERWRRPLLDEVIATVAREDVVVVGMAWNPHVPRARKALDAAGVRHTYLGYGSYASGWKDRLAIKLWSGWPTFPQVFVKGVLLGGADETAAALADGSLAARLRG